MDPDTPTAPAPPSRRRRRLARRLAIGLAVAAIVGAAGIAVLASDAALQFAVQGLIARSEGRLDVEGAEGSLLSAVRVKRLVWRGPEAALTADDIALTWRPVALWSRGIVVKGLGAQRITFAIAGSGRAVPLPASLALPTNVAIDEIAVAHFDWAIGANRGTITGLTFGYAGGAVDHRVERLSLVASRGTLAGRMTMDARPPFAVKGTFALVGDASLKEARADVAVSGTLDAVAVEAGGRAGDAQFVLRAKLTPLSAVALSEFSLDAHDLDLAFWDAALPATRVSAKAQGRPIDGGLAGSVEATNAIPGPLDAQRLPLRSFSAHFAWRADELALDDLVAEFAGGGRASGQARLPLGGNAGRWSLDVRDVNLKAIYTPLVATRLSGALGADLDALRQKFDGRVADRGIAGGIGLSFAAILVDRRLAIERFQIRARDGELAGRGAFDLAGQRAFYVVAAAKHVDPSRFGNFPAGNIDGSVAARGTLAPAFHAGVDVAVAGGSLLDGVPLSGTARATVSAHAVRDASVDLRLASARLTANGNAGEGAEGLSTVLDVPRLAELSPLLPSRVPRPLSGTLRASAVLRGDVDHGGLEFQAHGEAFKLGTALTLGTLDARVSIAPVVGAGARVGAPATGPADERRLQVDLSATSVTAPQGKFPRAHAAIHGTLAQHAVSLDFAGEDLDVDASAHGGVRESRDAAGARRWAWTGTVDALENQGPWAVRLAAPAALEFARGHIRVGAARLAVAEGNVELAALAWDDGHVSSRGAFAAVPVATIARLSGVKLPLTSTLTLAGDWSLAAAPRLNGRVTVRREGGDFFLDPETVGDFGDRAFGVAAIDVSARFLDDAVDASAAFRSARGVNAEAKLAVGVAPDAPAGRIGANAPVRLEITADLATLKILQPWVGTTAIVDGSAHTEIVASGTVARAPLSGTVRAAGLRIEAPQYGLHFTDGRLTARLADGMLELDEFSIVGGAGRFTASGTMASAAVVRADGPGAAGRMTWSAERFRVFNRPDLRLVVGGAGTLALEDRKITLEGKLNAEEGHFEYKAETGVTLGDDVVVKGWPAMDANAPRRSNLPLAIDLELDLGQRLTFAGEGLDTGLRGTVRVTTAADGSIRGRGSIQAVNGTYRAFGQRLVIDRGRLIFDGPLDNPGLDIVALRKNLAVEAGVTVSGTVKVPIIQLTSNPPVPDNEKLSWLVLGQGLDRTSGSDIAALQAASAALLGRGGKSVSTTVAESFGLDDISVGRGASASRTTGSGSPEASRQVVAFGKRITDKLSLVYEQGLTVATNALRLEYTLSRTLTLRAEAGAISGFGIYYRRVFD